MKFTRVIAISCLPLALSACMTTSSEAPFWTPLLSASTATQTPPRPVASTTAEARTDAPASQPGIDVETRRVPSLNSAPTAVAGLFDERPSIEGPSINATFPSQSIPAFINTVFGEVLQQPFSLGPGVAENTETISLRSVREMAPETFLLLVEEALKDYGLAVDYNGGLYRIIELNELRAQMPQFIRSRSRAGVPEGLQPVVQFVELTAIDAADMQQILEQAFPDRQQLSIRSNRNANSVILTGLASDVNDAVAIIEQMDELRFANTQVVTFSPRNWDANELAASLNDILATEGYFVSVGTSRPRPIVLLPLGHTNQILIFSRDRSVSDHIVSLARRLDLDAFRAEAQRAHVYQVRNTSAADLAEIVSNVTASASGSGSGRSQPVSDTGGEGNLGAAGSDEGTQSYANLTVDEPGNRIIFFGTQTEYEDLLGLMTQLDTALPEVMIEVTIAEVTLTDNMNYGLDAAFSTETASRFAATLNSNSGFSGVVNTGQVTLSASANAGNNQINILSTPRIITRSGSDGYVQVGTDVPIITSQRAANSQTSGSTDVLQTVEYRSTGIILSVTPVVYSGNRIDLVIDQQVSAAEANEDSSISSPVISNRSMTSEMSLRDGQTAVLGGLIETRFTRGNTGVPFVKDIPFLGAPFRNETFSGSRTMLVVLVTPFILDTGDNRREIVNSMISALNDGFQNQTRASATLRPPSEPFVIRGVNAGQPEPQ